MGARLRLSRTILSSEFSFRTGCGQGTMMHDIPFVSSVFHPTDFSDASEQAFAHALAIAVSSRARLDIMHAGGSLMEDWEHFPAVRKTLERWGMLPQGSPRSAVSERLGVAVTKWEPGGSPARACLRAIKKVEPELVVLSTEGRTGVSRWLHPSIAERVAHRTHASTLFVPAGGQGIVSLDSGAISLGRILIPVADRPFANSAFALAEQLVGVCKEEVAITTLHVNGPMPAVPTRPATNVMWEQLSAQGDVVEEILLAADSADLIIMPTEGAHGVWDALRGSTTSRVLREAGCPVLAVPAG